MDRPKVNHLLRELIDAFDDTPERFQLNIPGKEMLNKVYECLGYPLRVDEESTPPKHVQALLDRLDMDWSDEPDAMYCEAELWAYVHVVHVVWSNNPIT